MQQLVVDFITSLDGYASAEGWPGFWGLEGPEYLAWLEEDSDPHATMLMGATTYRLMSGFAAEAADPDSGELRAEEADSVDDRVVSAEAGEQQVAREQLILQSSQSILKGSDSMCS